ncbi:hypothetical protein AXX16_2057 [Serratia rubidaea]|nr:hypothetical protein AXX16_2057 [Serratia rubidaea]
MTHDVALLIQIKVCRARARTHPGCNNAPFPVTPLEKWVTVTADAAPCRE